MSATYQILSHKDLDEMESLDQAFASDVLVGLSQTPKKLASRYFYDEKGSRLFQKIMDLPEYYLTACELDILNSHTDEFSSLMEGESFNLVELGAGDGRKTSILLEHFLKKKFNFQYIPIDISEASMQALARLLNAKFPELSANGIVAEYFDGLKWLNYMNSRRNMVLFLGSNLGNFDKAHARAFLHNLWNALNDGDFAVIGFDLKKDIDLMLKAYSDVEGITAEFNLNLLRRINRELGGDFDLTKFQFHSSYDVFTGAMESYLVSKEKQTVFIKELSQTFSFDAWEPIHTEYSYKYLESDITDLADETGFVIEKQLYDSKKYFVDSIWRVQKIDAV
ncbi:MAG: L-histidine N(alpha)-methyltransferase [Candidatus Aminicenantes bacterium]|jgi:dimethylhistidine N-methyltransferase